MVKLISIDVSEKVKFQSQVSLYLNPDLVYVPLPTKRVEIKKEKNVKKGSLLFSDTYSPVSGKLVKLEKCLIAPENNTNCIVIHNDYQEKLVEGVVARKRISDLTKEKILASIYEDQLKEKLSVEGISTIYVKCFDDDPYIKNEAYIQSKNTKIVLETIDCLLNIFPKSKAFVVVKNTDSASILAFNNFLGTYKNIELKLVEDLFLIGREEFLVKRLHGKGKYIYLSVSEVYMLYMNLKKQRPLSEKYITLSGDALPLARVVRTKLGVKVLDILKSFYKEDFSFNDFYFNGIMFGKKIDPSSLIVTKDFEGLVIMKPKQRRERTCIKCGKCISVCPIHSNPLLAYKKGRSVRCIHCGLCTYICPSFIALDRYLEGVKK